MSLAERRRGKEERCQTYMMSGGEVNPGPKARVVVQTRSEYISRGVRCTYDGQVISGVACVRAGKGHARLNAYTCGTCGVLMPGKGPFRHVSVDDQVDPFGVVQAPGPVPSAPPAPAEAAVIPAAVAETAAVGHEPEAARAANGAGPVPAPPIPVRPSNQPGGPPPPVTAAPVPPPSRLDGHHLTWDEAVGVGRMKKWGELVGLDVQTLTYAGEKRIVSNRNVTETKATMVFQRLRYLAEEKWYPLVLLVVLSVLAMIWPAGDPAGVARAVLGGGYALYRAHTGVSRLRYSMLIGVILNLATCSMYVRLVASVGMVGYMLYRVFSGAHVERIHFGLAIADLTGLGYVPGLSFFIVDRGSEIGLALMARLENQTSWRSRRQRETYVAVHALSCVLAEYAPGTGPEAAKATCRSKLMRLATLPIEDRMHVIAMDGTEAAAMYLLREGNFFAFPALVLPWSVY